ncbi:MAG: O2-independent ubiquinone biosynthesis protein UbiV, partial [Pseudomonadota bacterium]|nr:O2-independent ubiquinone biosynthesis protein UbiV [Pseudomonadota bacterium]
VPPLEADRKLIDLLHKSRPAGVETEVFVFGKLPLAFSARCFTARHYNLNKDDCQFKCLDHPEGMTLKTREGQAFLCINGIQTMSAQSYNLLGEVATMREMGIDIIRVSPQPKYTTEIVAAFDAARRGELISAAASTNPAWNSEGLVDGYWFGDAGIVQRNSQAVAELQGA